MILIFGADGQLGRAFSAILPKGAFTAFDRSQADFSSPGAVTEKLREIEATCKPDWVINCTGYTQVDLAETEEDQARVVNRDSPLLLAQWCKTRQIPLIHFSTDYVFDGSGSTPKRESDPTGPLSAYGRTKLAGENAVAGAGCEYLIFRTSWIYAEAGKNFLLTMLKLGAEKETLKVVSDQWGAPTYARDLAQAVMQVIEVLEIRDEAGFPSGIYHLCNSGETNWHDFSEKIFEIARAKSLPLKVKSVNPISSAEFKKDHPNSAVRPLNSRLSCQKVTDTFGVVMPSWDVGVRHCLSRI